MDYMTQAEYAKYRGVSAPAVSKAIRSGRIDVYLDEKGRKLIDPVKADAQWSLNSSPTTGGDTSKKDIPLFDELTSSVNFNHKSKPVESKPLTVANEKVKAEVEDRAKYWKAKAEREVIEKCRADLRFKNEAKEVVPLKPTLAIIAAGNRRVTNLVQDICKLVAPTLEKMENKVEIQNYLLGEFQRAFTEMPSLSLEDFE